MKALNYLFYKYWKWQNAVGNEGVATLFTILFIFFIVIIYFYSSLLALSIFFDLKGFNGKTIIIILSFVFVFLCFYFYSNSNFEKIIRNKEFEGRTNSFALLFPIVAFALLALMIILIIFKNNNAQ